MRKLVSFLSVIAIISLAGCNRPNPVEEQFLQSQECKKGEFHFEGVARVTELLSGGYRFDCRTASGDASAFISNPGEVNVYHDVPAGQPAWVNRFSTGAHRTQDGAWECGYLTVFHLRQDQEVSCPKALCH